MLPHLMRLQCAFHLAQLVWLKPSALRPTSTPILFASMAVSCDCVVGDHSGSQPAIVGAGCSGQAMLWQQGYDGAFGDATHLPALKAEGGAAVGDVMCLAATPGGWLLACTSSGSCAVWNYNRYAFVLGGL